MKKYLQCRVKGGAWCDLKIGEANTFWTRFIGLMGQPPVAKTGILLAPTQSIHTSFMRYNLDVVLLDKENKVLKTYRNLKPWRVTFHWKAMKALEVPAGSLPREIDTGQYLEFKHV